MLGIFEDKIVRAVAAKYHEEAVNVLLSPVAKEIQGTIQYSFEIKDKEQVDGLTDYWNRLAEKYCANNELTTKKQIKKRLWTIFCISVTVLWYLLEETASDDMTDISDKYTEIKRYFKDYKKAWKKPLKTLCRETGAKYSSEYLKTINGSTEINVELDRIAADISAELPNCAPEIKIAAAYHYYRHHTAYNEDTFIAFCKMLGMNEQQPKELTAFKTTKSIDEIMEGIKGEIYSEENLQEWYNQIYGNVIEVSKNISH